MDIVASRILPHGLSGLINYRHAATDCTFLGALVSLLCTLYPAYSARARLVPLLLVRPVIRYSLLFLPIALPATLSRKRAPTLTMADPLLTSLCTICRVEAPIYKCPRCGTRTCSLSCVKKHKNWSSCNGERDPTVFITLDKLKTDAGIDHDYNFLTKIERSVERAERVLREDRDILPQKDTEPPRKKTRFNKGQSRGRTTVGDGSRQWNRGAIQRMRELRIRVSSVPYGMTRSKENKTTWNNRTRTINWQVEWLLFDTEPLKTADGNARHKRMLYKALDETPLYIAFAEALEFDRQRQLTDRERAEEKKALRKQQAPGRQPQEPSTSTWQKSVWLMQNHTNGAWDSHMEGVGDPRTAKHKYQFFFPRPKNVSGGPRRLVRLDASDTLANLLSGQEIIEFPTIHVSPAGVTGFGEGYTIEEKEKRELPRKRKASVLVDYRSGAESPVEEDGQIMEQDIEAHTSDDTTSSSGSDTDMGD